MNINYKQSQFELFPGAPGAITEAGKPRFFFANVTLTLENFVVVVILAVMMVVLSYSYGVERGKRVVVSRYFRTEAGGAAPVVAAAPAAAEKTQPVQNHSAEPKAGLGLDAATSPVANLNAKAHPGENSSAEAAVAGSQNTLQNPQSNVYSVPRSSAPSDKPFTVQIASYKSEKFAQKQALDLKNKGYESSVMAKGSHIIICVGRFAQEQEAQTYSDTFRKKFKEYKDCLVRRL